VEILRLCASLLVHPCESLPHHNLVHMLLRRLGTTVAMERGPHNPRGHQGLHAVLMLLLALPHSPGHAKRRRANKKQRKRRKGTAEKIPTPARLEPTRAFNNFGLLPGSPTVLFEGLIAPHLGTVHSSCSPTAPYCNRRAKGGGNPTSPQRAKHEKQISRLPGVTADLRVLKGRLAYSAHRPKQTAKKNGKSRLRMHAQTDAQTHAQPCWIK
jgi:hypothetical protein